MSQQSYRTKVAEIDLSTPDGTMGCHVITPERAGPLRAVIVYMPASGIRSELVGIASRIAAMGHATVLPNSFYRLARHVDIDANRLGDDDYLPVREFMMSLADNITNPRIIADTGAILDWLDAQDGIDARTVGGVGYCMGGRLVMASVGAYPERFAAAASLYGAGIVTNDDDSPHLRFGAVGGELYFGLAENDIYVSTEETTALREYLPTIDVRYSVETYPGTEHGFVFPERYCFSPEGAELHYERVADLFARNLR